MTLGLALAALAVVSATAAALLAIREFQLRAMNARVAAVLGSEDRRAPVRDVARWLGRLGLRFRSLYSPEEIAELRTIIQSSGFNIHRTLPIWIGVKLVCLVLFPLVALLAAELAGWRTTSVIAFTVIAAAVGVMTPRLILSTLKRRFALALRRGTPDALDLLVICTEGGMGLEGAIERVSHEMSVSDPPMAMVLRRLLDDLRVLPSRRAAFDRMGATSHELRRFGAMMNQSLQYGTPLGQALRAIAEELRRERLIDLEERAHRLSAELTIPLVAFMLPAMFIILGASPALRLMRTMFAFKS